MDSAAFTRDAPGRLVCAPEGYWTFVPNALPPVLSFDRETLLLLSEADRSLGELQGVSEMLPNARLLINSFVRREAVLSSTIEGTVATVQQLVLFEASPSDDVPAAREVQNYIEALTHGLEQIGRRRISLGLIREMHERLLDGVRGQDQHPGTFRERQNAIGQRGQTPEDARFVPPPPLQAAQALRDLEQYIRHDGTYPPLIELALIHYQFEAIHPFMDGNGRIGRLLISLLLRERGILSQPLLYLSAYFERRRRDYMDHLLQVSQSGAWPEWIRFFLAGVIEQARDSVRRSQQLLRLREEYRRVVQDAGGSARLTAVTDELFILPVLWLGRVRGIHSGSQRGAQISIAKLVELGIVREATGRQRNRLYVADAIVSLTEADKAPA